MNFYPDTVPEDTKKVLERVKDILTENNFYLSGGTALSLQLGHRESEDLDFFIETEFKPAVIQEKLSKYVDLSDVIPDENTLQAFVSQVKIQLLYYPYHMLENYVEWNGVRLSSVADIACTKLMTISSRGAKKDFLDMYFILQQISLQDLFSLLGEKYHGVHYNHPHILKSLIYFNDANNQPMPKMHKEVSWDEVKEFLTQEVQKIIF